MNIFTMLSSYKDSKKLSFGNKFCLHRVLRVSTSVLFIISVKIELALEKIYPLFPFFFSSLGNPTYFFIKCFYSSSLIMSSKLSFTSHQ